MAHGDLSPLVYPHFFFPDPNGFCQFLSCMRSVGNIQWGILSSAAGNPDLDTACRTGLVHVGKKDFLFRIEKEI